MSVSCVGTCSTCGARRFWLSDTMALQFDDGRLECLPHPAKSGACERHGLTLAQASERGRLYRETFYVCRSCGRDGETIRRQGVAARGTVGARGAMKWGWGSAAIVVPLLAWAGWWDGVVVIGGTLAALPAIYWRENRKAARAIAARGLPREDAPGRRPVDWPAAGSDPGTVIGRAVATRAGEAGATGPCCEQPDWVEAFGVTDDDRVPCRTCGRGVMGVSERAIH